MKRLLLLSGLLILLFGCSSVQTPEGVLTEAQMKAVLKDIHLTEAYLNTISDLDSVEKVSSGYYQMVLKKHHTDLKQFEKSLKYYAKNPVLLDSMYSQINAGFQKKIQEVSKPIADQIK